MEEPEEMEEPEVAVPMGVADLSECMCMVARVLWTTTSLLPALQVPVVAVPMATAAAVAAAAAAEMQTADAGAETVEMEVQVEVADQADADRMVPMAYPVRWKS